MKYILVVLALSLVITGCLNTIFTKYQDNQDVAPGKRFEQPVLQTVQMFIGESAAWIFVFLGRYYTSSKNQYSQIGDETKASLPKSKRFLLAIPSTCDLLGTTLMNLGLMYSPASIYQMMRGALIIFVALFSILFLKRVITRVEWLALATVILGITIVGISGNSGHGVSEDHEDIVSESKVFLGICMILLAQVFTATQFVVEEHIVGRWHIEPLELVGYEGIFGGSITLLGWNVLYMMIGYKTNGPFDIVNSFKEFVSNPAILYSSIAIMCSIGLFNFIGITLTSKMNATARSTIDTCRTLLVWLVSLRLGWETFKYLQLIGFFFLVFGTLVFNHAITIDQYLPAWFLEGPHPPVAIIDSIDEQIERQ